MEVNDIVLFDHLLLLNRSNDIDYKEGIMKSTISLMNFLKKMIYSYVLILLMRTVLLKKISLLESLM